MLSKAFCSVTEDPLVGTDQKGSVFWKKVQLKFAVLYQEYVLDAEEAGSDCIVVTARDQGSLMNRFKKQIQYEVNLFNGYYLTVTKEKPSGWSKEMMFAEAAQRFNEAQGKAFKCMHCVDILHTIPKFDPFIGGEEEDTAVPAVHNQLGNTMGGSFTRPMGAKSAKKIERDNRSLATNLASIESKKLAGLQGLGNSTERIAMAMHYQTENKTRL